MAENGGYEIGDVANGYVLTEHGWQPVTPSDSPAPPQYRVGDVVGSYVLTEQGWQVLAPRPVQPAYQPAPGTGGRRGLWIVLAVFFVVILGGIAIVAVALTSARNNASTSPPVTSTAAPSPSRSSTAPSSPSPSTGTATGTAGGAAQGKTFAFGESAQLTLDGVDAAEITVGAPVEFASTNQLDKAEKGRFVYVPVTVKVTGKEKVPIKASDFEVLLPDGQRLDVAVVAGLPKDAPAELDEVEVSPGQTLTGSVPFDVPTSTPLKVAYAPDADVLGTWQ